MTLTGFGGNRLRPEPAVDDQTSSQGDQMSYYRKNENRPALTGRKLRRRTQRTQARTEQRPGRPVIGHRDRAVVAARNANIGLMTVGEYLHGIGFPEADRLASAFGRVCAKAYRASHDAEPLRIYAAVNGRIRRSQFGYTDVVDLLAGAQAYGRTAEFLAVEQNTTATRTPVNA